MGKGQQSRVEAARKFWASAMTERDQDVFEDAIDDEHGAWFMPDGSDSGWGNGRMRAVDAWKEWAKADADRRDAERRAAPGNDSEVECNSCGATFALAARWAHVCPLPERYAGRESAPTPPLAEMFRFRTVDVLHNGLGCSALVADGVSDAQARQVWADGVDSGRYKLGGYRIWLTAVCGWVHVLEEHDTVLRAEEAESKVAEVVPAPVTSAGMLALPCAVCGASLPMMNGSYHVCAPVAPMTLDAAREAAKAHGYRLVHESGYERPDVILTRMLQYKQMTEADWDEYQRRVLAVRDAMTDDAERMAVVDAEIARLRALGVVPAVLK